MALPKAYRALLAAILTQAVTDARRGSQEARNWLMGRHSPNVLLAAEDVFDALNVPMPRREEDLNRLLSRYVLPKARGTHSYGHY